MDSGLVRRIVLDNDLLDEDRLRQIEALAAGSDASLIDTIVGGGYVREEAILPLIAAHFGLRWLDLEGIEAPDPTLVAAVPAALRRADLLPLQQDNGHVLVAMADVTRVELLDELARATGWAIEPICASRRQIRRRRDAGATAEPLDEMAEISDESLDGRSLEEQANEAPVIKRVNLIIMQAISEGASDIHLEPYESRAVVRYRVDGVMHEASTFPIGQYPAIASRVKIMAHLDIAERRLPQDGRISLRLMDRDYDLRVATVPVLHGESVVMRILDKGNIQLDLDQLGFAAPTLATLRREVASPHGIVLVTGPTGSGKTTTLYATLASIKSDATKIITVEDPVEYQLDGVNQIHVNTKVGLTFAAGLRSILRLDPDVIMVGEIRDAETADIAVRASLTGHLVFSTLHTNDAAATISRLLDMEVEPFLVSATLRGVLAQRLVRRICEFCREPTAPDAAAATLLRSVGSEATGVFVGRGCDQCNDSGYSGRTGVHEMLAMDDELRALVNERAPADAIRNALERTGFRFMRHDGVAKVLDGVTTAEEVLRVTQID